MGHYFGVVFLLLLVCYVLIRGVAVAILTKRHKGLVCIGGISVLCHVDYVG